MDNTNSRLHDVFFYGLYMDPDILESKGVSPRNPRSAYVKDYQLRVGTMATLLRKAGGRAYGMVYSLTHNEIDLLYRNSGLDMYAPEALVTTLQSGEKIPTLCCNLVNPPSDNESNSEYKEKLIVCMKKLKLSTNYV